MEFQAARFASGEPARPPARALQGDSKFLPFEGLDEIIVAARFEDRFPIDVIAPARDDDDASQVEFLANSAGDLESAHSGEKEIAHDRVRAFRKSELDAGFAFERFDHVPAVATEEAGDAFAALHIIFDEQYRR